jgi:hypothetical protein
VNSVSVFRLVCSALLPCLASWTAQAGEVWSFGVLPQRSAVLTAQYWNPILSHVEKRTGIRLELKVGIDSKPGAGATVWFRISLALVDGQDGHDPARSDPA